MTSTDKSLHIDIPVKLVGVKAVFSVATLTFQGDLPTSVIHLQRVTSDIADWGATSEVVTTFHTNAGTSRCTIRPTTRNATSRPGTPTRN
jgi:hypothetical protein